jgi:hypothetical protein
MSDISAALRRFVFERAGSRCEYCRIPLEFDALPGCLDHIIARKHRGPSIADNLAVSCYHDNSFKGDNIAGIEPETVAMARLYDPRHDEWHEHFAWDHGQIVGLTAIGRTTVYVLNMNEPIRVLTRRLLVATGDISES